MTCDLIAEIASLTGWDEKHIWALPMHHAHYYHLKSTLRRGMLSEWLTP